MDRLESSKKIVARAQQFGFTKTEKLIRPKVIAQSSMKTEKPYMLL